MHVDLDWLYNVKKRLRIINSQKIEDIVFISDGVEKEVPEDELLEWKFMGLNNTDLPEMVTLKNKEN